MFEPFNTTSGFNPEKKVPTARGVSVPRTTFMFDDQKSMVARSNRPVGLEHIMKS